MVEIDEIPDIEEDPKSLEVKIIEEKKVEVEEDLDYLELAITEDDIKEFEDGE